MEQALMGVPLARFVPDHLPPGQPSGAAKIREYPDFSIRSTLRYPVSTAFPLHVKFTASTISALLLLSVAIQASGQDRVGLDPGLRITQHAYESWQVEDGLPQNSVRSIAQTRDGYIWMATDEGLVRFDGLRFTVHDPDNTPALLTAEITHLVTSPDGTLWMSIRNGGLVRYRDGQFEAVSGSPLKTLSLEIDHDGTLWAGSYGQGLIHVVEDSATVILPDLSESGDFIGGPVRAVQGKLFVPTRNGLFILEGDRLVQSGVPGLDGTAISALVAGQDGSLWIGTNEDSRSRLINLAADGTSTEHTHLMVDGGGYVTDVLFDAEGSMWFGQENGGITRVSNQEVDRFDLDSGLSDNQALTLFRDLEGSLWIGTSGGGVNRIHRGLFAAFTTLEGLPHENTYTVLEDQAGIAWIGTEAGVVGVRDNEVVASLGKRDGLRNERILALAEDRLGGLWIGTRGGGASYRSPNGKLVTWTQDDGLSSNVVFAILVDSDDGIWFGTDAGVNYLNGGTIRTFTTEDGLTSDFPAYFAQDSKGVWIGAYDAGLSHIVDGSVDRVVEGLPGEGVLALLVDGDDRLWVGTYGGGLAVVDEKGFRVIDRKKGLFDNVIMSVVEDDHGRLWMSSNKGIFAIEKREALAVLDGSLDRVRPLAFDERDGLKIKETNGGQQPSAFKASDGSIWFPTVKGAVYVEPAMLDLEVNSARILVESLRVDGREYAARGEIQLPPGADRLEFDFTATGVVIPSKVRFAFRLIGYDDEWIDSEGRREVFYTNLKPGHYELEVTSILSDGSISDRSARLSFYLAPHFWQTTWFAVLCVLIGLISLIVAYQARIAHHRRRAQLLERKVDERTEQLRKEKELTEQAKNVIEAQAAKLRELDHFKTRFFANVSHEFRTPLTMIIGPLENALAGRYGDVQGKVRSQMDIMLRNAVRLMRLINQLLDLSKLEAGKMQLKAGARNIVRFLNDVMTTITPFAEKKGLTLSVTSSDDRIDVYYEPDKLEKVFYNLLSNASKFTPEGGRLAIDIATREADDTWSEGSVEIRVSDTGKGIPKKDLPHIFDRFRQVDGSNTREHEGTGIGLSLVKEMVTLHGGTVEVESEVGRGTTFVIVFPLGCAHLQEDQVAQNELTEFEAPKMSTYTSGEFRAEKSAEEQTSDTEASAIPNEVPEDAATILVVDDNSDVREYVGSIVSEFYHVIYAVDGQDGLDKVRGQKPDLVLSDIQMPRMDGTEMCRIIKEDEDLRHTPVILVSARATQQTKMEGLHGGADDYVPKPFNADELLARVGNLLKLRHHEKLLQELNERLEEKVEEQLGQILSERERYEAELIEERDRAQAASKMKSSILDNMNHEFRTPLSIILGSTQILAEELPEHLTDFANDIDLGARRLLGTLESVAELSSLSAGLDVAPEPLELVAETRQAVDAVRHRAEEKGLQVNVKAPKDTPVELISDRESYSRILEVLLDNAVRYTDQGEILVEVARRADYVEVRVRDTGRGIPPEHHEGIFDMFSQGAHGLVGSHEGFGIGLSIAAGRAELIGAELTVESEVGEGSVFTLRIPLSAPPHTVASGRAGKALAESAD